MKIEMTSSLKILLQGFFVSRIAIKQYCATKFTHIAKKKIDFIKFLPFTNETLN